MRSSVFTCDGSMNSFNSVSERRDMFRDDCANNVIRDSVVFMAQNIADSNPGHIRHRVHRYPV